MRGWGILLVAGALCASVGCSKKEAERSGPLGATSEDVGIPREHAAEVLKVLESANAHNDRLQRMEQRLFDEKEP